MIGGTDRAGDREISDPTEPQKPSQREPAKMIYRGQVRLKIEVSLGY
jgi:hypothetical protein